MSKQLVTLTLTDDDCLNVRLALNATAMEWGDKASAHRASGAEFDARVCEQLRSEYHRLWEVVNVAQEAAPPVHNGFHPPGFDPSTCAACNVPLGDTAPRMRSGDFMVALAFSR